PAEGGSMDNATPIPTSLKIVAFLFILGGILALTEAIVSLTYGQIYLNFAVLGLFIGPGLLRLSRGWRTCALVFLWIALIGAPVVAVLLISASGPFDLKLFGQQVGDVSKGFGVAFIAVMFVLAWWQYRVLTRADVRRLFGLPGA